MKREDTLNSIFSQLDAEAEKFCKDTGGIFCNISGSYKGEELPENLKYRFAKIHYSSFILEFKYTAHGMLNVVNSILECLVYFEKSEDAVAIPLPFLLDYCDIDAANLLCIPFISNKECMTEAFESLCSTVKAAFSAIESISFDDVRKEQIKKRFSAELKEIWDIELIEVPSETGFENITFFEANEWCYVYITLRFCGDAFISLLKGKREKAVKQLSKAKHRVGYEERFLNILKSEKEIPILPRISENTKKYAQNGAPQSGFKELGTLFFSWVVLSVATSAFYVAVYCLLLSFENAGSVYLMGPSFNFPYCIMFGFITAIALSYFTRLKFYKFLHKKDFEAYSEMDHIQNGGGSDKTMKVFTALILAISLAGCLLLSRWNINFQQNGFVDNTNFFALKGEYYSYSEIERVYYLPERINGFGETLDFPSYVLVTKSGKELDFYELDEIERYENTLISFLEEKGVKIEKDK